MATEAKRKAIAKHELLDNAGNVMEEGDETNAGGVRYSLLAGGDPVDVIWDELNDGSKRMFGLFGVKTLLTNVSSQSRQAGRSGVAEQLEDIHARLALIQSGQWVDRTREAFKPDLDMLVNAFAETAIAGGKVTEEQVKNEKFAAWRQRAEEDAAWVKDVYAIPAGKEAYARLAGKTIKTVDDLM